MAKFACDVLVASIYEIFDVLNDLHDGAALIERLRRHLRSVTVMNAIVPPLKDPSEAFLELVDRLFARRDFIGIDHR